MILNAPIKENKRQLVGYSLFESFLPTTTNKQGAISIVPTSEIQA